MMEASEVEEVKWTANPQIETGEPDENRVLKAPRQVRVQRVPRHVPVLNTDTKSHYNPTFCINMLYNISLPPAWMLRTKF